VNDITYRVVEIFDSLEGEGKRAGATATFIRLAGCNLRCTYCDTAQALAFDAGIEMTLGEILAKVNMNYKRVTLTGGEPLLADDVDKLVAELIKAGCEVNIETNGSVDITHFRTAIDNSALFFTIDYKLPASGMENNMFTPNYFLLKEHDVLKFVVSGAGDVSAMLGLLKQIDEKVRLKQTEMPQVYIGLALSPNMGYDKKTDRFNLETLAKIILHEPLLKNARMQLQFHKIIWGPDVQGV
jgi:7-carboxy-7-deazaguanine synthase